LDVGCRSLGAKVMEILLFTSLRSG